MADETIGDIMANVSCTTVGARMLMEFMDEYRLDDLTPLADAILSFSERALRDALGGVTGGAYRNQIQFEGHDRALSLACAVHIADGEALVDFSGIKRCRRRRHQCSALLHARDDLLCHQGPHHAENSEQPGIGALRSG